ncbi:MAG: zf-HC2 domain-containing protein, partial [bacterium]
KHSAVQTSLYDFLQNQLSEEEHGSVQQHLAECASCARELTQLRQTLSTLPSLESIPDKGEGFFNALAVRIETAIREEQKPRQNVFTEFIQKAQSFVTLRPAYAYSFGGALAMIILAVFFFVRQPERHVEYAANEQPLSDYEFARLRAQQRMGNYLQKSKTLLVGIANMKESDQGDVDFSAERKLSRTLVHEARYLKSQPIDERSARLVRDLQKILIELANLEKTNDLPNVEMIRTGINQENLLFKIRMAEASLDTNRATNKIY